MPVIRTPDQRLRVFVSSTLAELADARAAVRRAVDHLRLTPVMFELGARPHPPRDLYRAYLEQSDLFVGIYGRSYGWIAPGDEISGLEDEFRLSGSMPRLLYVREPEPDREGRLEALLEEVRKEGTAAYKVFSTADELESVVAQDLAVLLTERFEAAAAPAVTPAPPTTGALIEPDNPIVGREGELADVIRLLRKPEVRLLTLTGAAGIGKSRVAIEIGQLLRDEYAHGVWTVPLETVHDPALVMPTVAHALGVRSATGEDPLAALKSRLLDREALLILDNFEHIASTAADVADLLSVCPDLRVLVTSRMPLRVRGENEYPIPPLTVPDPETATVDALHQAPAVALFLARAEAVSPHAVFDDHDLRDIARICHRVDGIPLAIELAAARSRLFSPSALLSRLDQRLPLLTGGNRDAPERHRTLRGAIDWGYELLDPVERTVLRRLAVFSGGWTLAAQEEVLPAAGPVGADSLDVLESLLLKNFVIRARIAGPEPRLSMLETIREYAREKLAESADLEATSEAHAAHYLAFAEQAAPETHGPEQVSWLDALERDHDNLRSALTWFEERGDLDDQIRLTAALGRFWMVHCHFVEALRWLTRGRDASTGRTDRARAEVLSWLGVMAWLSGDVALSEAAHSEALPIRRALDDRHGEHIELLALGIAAFGGGDHGTATSRWWEVVRLAEEAGDDDVLARALANLGFAARVEGDLAAARPLLERAIALHEESGDPQAAIVAMLNLAGVALDAGDLDDAERLAVDAVSRAEALGDVSSLAEGLETVAALRAARERPVEAAWLFGATETLRRRTSVRRLVDVEPFFQRDVERARRTAARRGETEAFEEAWRAGCAVTREETISRALDLARVGGESRPPVAPTGRQASSRASSA